MRGLLYSRIIGTLIACAGATVVIAAAPANAQGSYSPYNETASAALARYLHMLANDPQDFNSLIGAGRAAIELGDAQAAAGFFARADEVNPRSPDPQAGMGAVSVANGDAKATDTAPIPACGSGLRGLTSSARAKKPAAACASPSSIAARPAPISELKSCGSLASM